MDDKVKDAVEFMRASEDGFSTIRAEAMDDLRFSYGDQWPLEQQNSRLLEKRPCLTVNKLDSYIRQVTNGQRQQKPRGKVHPVDSMADPKIAKVIQGLGRHIEINSDADYAYDTAYDFTCRSGFGYWRLRTDYIRDDSFDQDIYIDAINNPWSVHYDPHAECVDGSDQKQCLITDEIKRDEYKRLYPGSDIVNFQPGLGDSHLPDWLHKDTIRVAEHYYIKQRKDKLCMLSNGVKIFRSKLPDKELLDAAGIKIVGDRDTLRNEVKWCKVNGMEVLEERDIPGCFIPVIPVFGTVVIIDGKKKIFGMTRFARDPQLMYNYWATIATESVAMAPKAKWLVPEGTDEGYELDFAQANQSAKAVLRYKPLDLNGQPAKPERIAPEPAPEGIITSMQVVSQDLQSVLGIFDPAIGRPQGNDKSGKAIQAEQAQSDESNYHYFDNLVRSIRHTWRIMLDWFPTVYDKQRVVRIIGEDGKFELQNINVPGTDENGVERVLNDVTVGTYDVVMDTGPAYQSQRLEAVDMMVQAVGKNPQLWSQIGDLIFRNSDFPGAEIIADRLAAQNPLAQIDEKSQIPPRVQMMIQQMKAQLDHANQVIAQAKDDIENKLSIRMAELNAQQQTEMAKIQAKHQVDMAEAKAKMIMDERGTQLEIFQAQQEEEAEMRKDRYNAELEAIKERQRATVDIAIAEHKASLEQSQAQAERQFDAWKATLQAEVQLMIAGMSKQSPSPEKTEDGEPKKQEVTPGVDLSAVLADAQAGFLHQLGQVLSGSRQTGIEKVRDKLTGKLLGARVMFADGSMKEVPISEQLR